MTNWGLREIPECGSERGYDYHTRHLKESPCTRCREAKKVVWREKRSKNRNQLNEWRRKNYQDPKRRQYELDSSARRSGKFLGDYSYKTILKKHGAVCHLCDGEINLKAPRRVGELGWETGLHFDHVISIAKGGEDVAENVRPAHAYCNQTKGTRCLKD